MTAVNGGELRDAAAVRDWLVRALASACGVHPGEVDTGDSFHDHGVSSSEAIIVCGELEEWLGQPVSPTLLYEHPTIDALVAALAGEPGQPAVTLEGRTLDSARQAVCLVGLGCRFPAGAETPEAFWANLVAAVDAAGDVPADRWDAATYFDPDPTARGKSYTTRGGFLADIAGFDAEFFGISPVEAKRMDPQQRLLLEVTWAALEDAGIAPDRLRGSRSGVFVGMMGSQEYGRLQTDHESDSCLDDPYFGYGTAPSVAAGRLSYVLDLRGPSLCVDTACSSSLLSVHLAAESLRRGECDLALAGGVSALLHPAGMVQACRAHMLAPDGRCKAFDSAADGFLMAEGCGMVVLERLDDALASSHRILAVVRGSAVSQDGRSNGMTAPNVGAQVQVVRDALAAAAVSPHQVGYVEAHGSGTKLGDAVEVSALQQVFGPRRDPQAPLVLGAVKSNIGHLLGAAGVAGLIKVVLALRHGKIPPNLHLAEANSTIDWSRCPMVLPEQVTDWPTQGEPRIAGVSSFGWSGTNVHLVLADGAALQQDDPSPSPVPAGAEWQLLPLSARTETALARVVSDLHDELLRRSDNDLADVAHTLQVGRAGLAYRLPLVCRDLPDTLSTLRTANGRAARYSPPERSPRTFFLFPGTGDHYVGMGRGLYCAEPVFQSVFDECARLLRPLLGEDLREIVHPSHSGEDHSGEDQGSGMGLAVLLGRATSAAAEPLNRVEFAHCAVFAVEYALAKLWQSWGVRLDAVLGYSLGEYVAACLAGVFSLPDALHVVARRAQLIGRLPAGAMLAVPLPARALEDMLPSGVSVAAHNGPAMTVAAGPVEQVGQLERLLDEQGVVHRRVNNGHALHTEALTPIRTDVECLVRGVRRGAAQIPVVSSRTGSWLTDEQAADPSYWAAQMCEPILFDQGVTQLAEQAGAVALEVGPGQTLSGLLMQTRGARERHHLTPIPTLRPVHVECSDREYLLRAVGQYWACGGQLDRDHDPEPGTRRILPLPTYPFEHQRYWPQKIANATSAEADSTGRREDLARWCYVPVWKQSFTDLRDATSAPTTWLVFTGGGEVLDTVATGLRESTSGVVTVSPGAWFRQLATDAYTIDPVNPADYQRLLDHLGNLGQLPTRVLHAWQVTSNGMAGMARPDQSPPVSELGFASMMHLFSALGRRAEHAVRVHVLSDDVHDVIGDEPTHPWKATSLGLVRTVDQEFPMLHCRSIEVASSDVTDRGREVVARLLAEIRSDDADLHVAYRGSQRWVQVWEPVRLEPPADPSQVWREGGVYLITGGLGELGLALARNLAARIRPRLALLGRSTLPPREQWDNTAAEDVRQRIEAVLELEKLGAEVLLLTADVADPAAVGTALDQVRERFGALHGVIHAAGVPASGLIQLKTRDDAERVLRPKVAGALALHHALRKRPLDFLVLYSSSVVALGGLGESDYCAANAFLDAFARRLRRDGFPATAIDWGPWRRDSWTPARSGAADTWSARLTELRARYGITDEEGVDVLTRVLASQLAQVLVIPQDLDAMTAWWRELSGTVLNLASSPEHTHPRPQLRTPYVAPRNKLEHQITEVWRQHIGVDRVGVNDQFFELGGSSLVGLTILARLEKELNVRLPAADLFEAPTPAALAGIVSARRGETQAAPRRGQRGARRRHLAEAASLRRAERPKGGSR